MTYSSQSFVGSSIRDLSELVSAFLAANPAAVPVSLSVVPSGLLYNAILIYGV